MALCHDRVRELALRPLMPMSAHTRRDGPGCRSTGQSMAAGIRSGTRTGLRPTPDPRVTAARPQFRSMRRPASSDRGQGKSCAWVRSDVAGTSPSAIWGDIDEPCEL